MTQITDSNYKEVIEELFDKNKTVVAMCGYEKCSECKLSGETIGNYLFSVETTNLAFVYMNLKSDFKLTEIYYEMEKMDSYPKTVIYNGSWEERMFVEGEITNELLNSLEDS